ncbi:MAG: hypothetical protein ACRBCL_00015 [Maritimibacter sp.]
MIEAIGLIFAAIFTIACFWFIFMMINQPFDRFDKVLRLFAAGLGFIFFFAARELGIGIPDLVLASVDGTGGLIQSLVSAALPALVGVIGTHFLLRVVGSFESRNEKAVYLVLMLLSIVAFVGFDTFWSVFDSGEASTNLLANTTFIGGILFGMLFNADLLGKFRALAAPSQEADEVVSVTPQAHNNWKDKL